MTEETLFHEALAKPPAERPAFLEQTLHAWSNYNCGACRHRGACVAAHEASGSLLDRPLAILGQTVDSDPGKDRGDATGDYTPEPHDSLPEVALTRDYRPNLEAEVVIAGRYVLEEKIGQGGMGEVWIAQQTEPVKRRVALKLIKTGMDSRAVLQRFEQERQALALMDHPNIARVFDGGLTPMGQPFLVMELVNGQPLTKFCDEARLTPRQRLELFVPICAAVQHAHQKGIVHRDLKPANILVTLIDGRPVPKVIDFGVAKATTGKLTDESLFTQIGAVIGTFEYMAPEQAGFTGEDIDTRADLYSLGVILYELLTGLRPHDARRLRKAALTEMVRIIREEEPPKPSTRLSSAESLSALAESRQIEPRKLMALLRGELDWVVMKCLEKQRDRRYETANALGRDIQRYLTDEPVEARPPSAGYRLSKFLRRNKGPVLAGSLVLLVLVIGIIGTTLGMLSAEKGRAEAESRPAVAKCERAEAEFKAQQGEARERKKAEQARDRTRQVLNDMTSAITGDSLTTQIVISKEQKKFLTEVLMYYQEFAGEKAENEASRVFMVEAAFRVGMIEARLGRKAEAVAALRQAREGSVKLAAEFPTVPDYRLFLATCHNNLGILLNGLGNRSEAEVQHGQARAILEQLAAEFPAVAEYRNDLANSHNNLGALLHGLGKLPQAEVHYRRSLALWQKLAVEFPSIKDYPNAMGQSQINLGFLLHVMGKWQEAEVQYRQTLAFWEKLSVETLAEPAYRQNLALIHHRLGDLMRDRLRGPEAEKHYRKALLIQEKLTAEFPGVPEYRQELADTQTYLGILLKNLGKWPEAEQQYRTALAILEKLAAEYPAVPLFQRDLGRSHINLGNVLYALGKGPEAEQQYRTALANLEKLTAEIPTGQEFRQLLALGHNNQAVLLVGLKKWSEAEEHHRQGLAIRKKLAAEFPADPRYRQEQGNSHANLGTLLANQEKRPEAEQQYRQALALQEKLANEFPLIPEYRLDLAGTHDTVKVDPIV